MIPPLSRTKDGFRAAVRHQPPRSLRPHEPAAAEHHGRVVTVSSGAHRSGRIDFDDLNWERRRYRRWPAYGQSKLANLLFTAELQRRLTEAGSPVLSMAAHPGYAATNLQSHSDNRLVEFLHGHPRQPPWWPRTRPPAALPTPTRRSPTSQATPSPARPPFFGSRGAPDPLPPVKARRATAEVARRLWQVSEQLTGVTFPEIQHQ